MPACACLAAMLIVSAALALGCGTGEPRLAAPREEEIRAAVDTVRERWLAADRDSDAAAAAALYEQGAILVNLQGSAAGRDAIRELLARTFESVPGPTAQQVTPDRIVIAAAGDLVYERGSWVDVAGRSGRYLVVGRRQPDGTWLIAEHMVLLEPAR